MKKFKLIKEYPGSDAKGTIAVLLETKYIYKGFRFNYDVRHVENSPEYWEEVIEKDYEILISRVIPYTILSVRRLSDGEVFSVGDRAMTQGSRGGHSIRQFKIKQKCNVRTAVPGIFIKDGIDRIWIDWEEGCGGNWLESTEKLKQPIFLTHDGKDIFAGDKVWWVNKKTFCSDYFVPTPSVTFFSDINVYFLTEEAAEDYIEKNKVLFITADGVGIKKGNMVHGVYRTSNTISSTVVACNRGLHDTFEAIFSTRAAAENYLVQKSHSLSIEDFWEFVSWGGSTIAKSKRLKRLVKDRLNLK
jgi:hypothetical protein